MMIARHSVQRPQAKRPVKNASEHLDGVLHQFLDVFLCVAVNPHGVDGFEHGAEAFALRRHEVPNSRLIGRWSVAQACHPADLAEVPWVRSRGWRRLGRRVRRDRVGRPVRRSCPAAGRRPGPSGYGQRSGPYVGRRRYRAAVRLFSFEVAVVSLPWRKPAGCACRIGADVDGLTCVVYLLRTNDPGWTGVAPHVMAHWSQPPNQLQRRSGAPPCSSPGRLGPPEIGRWRRPE